MIALMGFNSYNMQQVSIRLRRQNARDEAHHNTDDLAGLQFKIDISCQIAGSSVLLIQDLAVPGNITALKRFILAAAKVI